MAKLTQLNSILEALGMSGDLLTAGDLVVTTPIDGSVMTALRSDTRPQVQEKIGRACQAFATWRMAPAPQRGELIRLFAAELRAHKQALGALVTLECGKISQEGLGEVQEMIDICDFAVGLSRQLYGLTLPSERPGHKMAEYWHPIGPVGVISAFNFPVAVWAWNAALAIVCGDSVVWKPSEKTPVSALVCVELFKRSMKSFGAAPADLMQVIIGDATTGQQLAADPRVPVISATGSNRMGRAVAPVVAGRFGRCILELGGNNAMIVTPSADLELALRAIVFAAVGTTGQRCTTLRRLIVHDSIYHDLITKLKRAYKQIRIGNPFADEVLIGPLIDSNAGALMDAALSGAAQSGYQIHGGGRVEVAGLEAGCYVRPAIVEARHQDDLVRTETFAPILYVLSYKDFDEALALHNDVPQGLSSCIFTRDLLEAEIFLSARGSDCGIANINIGPSGAEIGGAFGGEKDTGGGRESGSDAWKGYMRRVTATTNYSHELPLAQGIRFDL
jgi:aldehyde dehydrogenase (NAD+)